MTDIITMEYRHDQKPAEVDKLAHAKEQGQAQFNSIKEMVERLEKARNTPAHSSKSGAEDAAEEELEAAEQSILDDALSVLVRDDWHEPGVAASEPGEYEILLCTGGPAVRIRGGLNEYSEPETARLEVQDWFTPWTEFHPINPDDHTFTSRIDTKAEEILLAYARCFYYEE